jgi:hypothetical protein
MGANGILAYIKPYPIASLTYELPTGSLTECLATY